MTKKESPNADGTHSMLSREADRDFNLSQFPRSLNSSRELQIENKA